MKIERMILLGEIAIVAQRRGLFPSLLRFIFIEQVAKIANDYKLDKLECKHYTH